MHIGVPFRFSIPGLWLARARAREAVGATEEMYRYINRNMSGIREAIWFPLEETMPGSLQETRTLELGLASLFDRF